MAIPLVSFLLSSLIFLPSVCNGATNPRVPKINAGTVSLQKRLIVPSNIFGFNYTGCYTDSTDNRSLAGSTFNGNTVTNEACISFCDGKGYVLAGTEYSGQCFCGNSLSSIAILSSDSDCGMACSGNSSEVCGGSNRITVFSSGRTPPPGPFTNPGPAGWVSLGCYADNGATRALNTAINVPNGGAALTVQSCTTACSGYLLAGLEYSQECYCGNELRSGATAVDSGCTMTCSGNTSEYCGGAYRLNLYSLGGAIPSTPASTISPTSSATPSATALPDGWLYRGCYIDNANGRVFQVQQQDNPTLTVASCITTCSNLGYSVAGMEYGVQCFCDNFVRNGGKLADQDTDCGINCGGSGEKCGAGDRLSVYSNSTIQVYQPPSAQVQGLPGKWNYVGCLSDVAGNPVRTFPYQVILQNNNTATNCLSLCSQYRYNAAGMEYGEECWCGDIANVVPNGAVLRPESECDKPCTGNASEICGGGNRLSYYTWNSSLADALYEWKYPIGASAGQYQFYVPGVVVPLITTLSPNGKITFLEKSGTGFPNTTGAYELDPSIVDAGGNWSTAWREMHVQSDIFCSATIVLPDKVGRQLNIGGWALGATFGVRLYWPDGSLGQASVNDWKEDYPNLSLQNGRWYPSAMIMANGSILVVGGQDGSNGKPIPTLELLPKVGGVITQDFLQRTDPYNLYPFLAVLPGGGILIAYYNEARVMDEKTFATQKVLPNMPAAVNNFLGGRSYPFEGTMVLMPQFYPYTDPITVLLCGGSVPGPEVALDNCVSIQPEVDNPTWTIERMPSQRVISCMTALPDGTYLIINGAHHGRAGFGTSSDPNLNAVLYDPSQPVHHRMSIMANTTVARLYHSEAILMQDGRVLVSGSDPQNADGAYPEEFRVEVFVPPYILSGASRPTFSISNKDWTYGQTIPITITAGYSTQLRVSLTGAESSTHGSSMGQRTIFPRVSCSGSNSCTITAPPNAHVCPPGWYQLWVLDGPTPSRSTFVRIGGDPGRVGEWPAVGGFSLPGV